MTTRIHGLMRVFWPADAPVDEIPGVVVGWRNSELDVFVVGVLQGVDVRGVEHAIRVGWLFKGSPHPVEHIWERCGRLPLSVLGTLNVPTSQKTFDHKLLSVHVTPRWKVPRIDCPADAGISIQVITFHRPDPKQMQYLSMTPISLALADKHGAFGSVPPFDRIDKEEEAERIRKERLVEKLKLHTVVRHSRTAKELALPTIINQINCSTEINGLMQQNIHLVGIRQKRSLSVSERVVESANDLWSFILLRIKQAFLQNVWPVASQIFILCLMILRILAEIILLILDWRPLPDSAALKDVSATAQQVDIRLQQFCYWPAQYITLHRRRSDWESIASTHPEYIRFFNSLWLVANDVIIGIAVGAYILENADLVAAQVDAIVSSYSIEGLRNTITWLMGWPAGLKLNTDLALFLGDLFLWVIDYWAGCMHQLRPAWPHIIRLVALSSFVGASLPVALFSDLLSVLTIHIYSFYLASARIYHWQLSIIVSLFHLFRGKKRNVLRSRIDRCDYDLDQLLLGTILFTLLFFLLPTVAVFYATFAGARIIIIAMKAGLDTWLACLNHFPLFALMLRVKDARRLPGGIRFEVLDPPASLGTPSATSSKDGVAETAYVRLKSVPLPLTQTFSQYAQLIHRLQKHYFSPRVFICLVSGQFVPPIHRRNLYSLQYSMLPIRRVGVGAMWNLLTRKEGEPGITPGVTANGRPGGGGTSVGMNGTVNPGLHRGKRERDKGGGMWWSK